MTNYYLGCSGWYYEHWRNRFYNNLPKKEWFAYYASQFNTVELNNTYYRFPTDNAVKQWYNKAPADFLYSVKVNRMVTHQKKFRNTLSLIKEYYRTISILNKKLGPVLFQLPPNMEYDGKRLREIIKQLDTDYTNVLEFRHSSWWNEKVYDMLKENNIVFCIVNAQGLPEDFIVTSKDIYIRMHGKIWYMTNYTKKTLASYADKIKDVNPRRAFVYFNNDFMAFAPKNCREMKQLI